VLAAFAELRAESREAAFLVVGELSAHYDLPELRSPGVRPLGRLEPAAFRSAMAACDAAVNLRHPTGGETSASLLALLAAGIPTIVSDHGSFAELPNGVAARVAVDELEASHLRELLRRLAADGPLRRQMSLAARRHVEREHRAERTAAGYAELLRELAAAPRELARVAPPLAPGRDDDPAAALLASIGAAVADLGLDEREAGLLAGVADEIVELGWSPGPEHG
jgi:glycosyltransferase involved in cell wall biosynthesis